MFFRKMIKYLIQTVDLPMFYGFWRLKKKALKMKKKKKKKKKKKH